MNDLEARRRLLADPQRLSPELREALQRCAATAHLREELVALDDEMRRILTRPQVPEGLAERIVLRARYGRRSRWAPALAASLVALAIALPWYWGESRPGVEVAMIQHVRESVDELRDDRGVEPAVLRASVGSLGVRVRDARYRVRHLGHCIVAGREGRHFTIDGPRGVVSFVLVPDGDGVVGEESIQRGDTRALFAARNGVVIGVFSQEGADRAELETLMREMFA